MAETFRYDVFLSHSAKDKAVVRALAERLRTDGLNVWFDEWEIKPGDHIPAKIEEGLEHSRVLLLCMSANAFGSDWAQLESGAFRFRDPLNKERRFIPLRLDAAAIKGSLAQFLYISGSRRTASGNIASSSKPAVRPSPGRRPNRRPSAARFEARILSLGHADRSVRSPSARTASMPSPARTTARCGCGTSSPVPASARSRATPDPSGAWR